MDPIVLYPSLIVGLILVLIHLFLCHRRSRAVNPTVLISAPLTGSGIVCGVLLIVGSFSARVMAHLTGINIYIFIAGVAVCYVAGLTIYKDFLSGDK